MGPRAAALILVRGRRCAMGPPGFAANQRFRHWHRRSRDLRRGGPRSRSRPRSARRHVVLHLHGRARRSRGRIVFERPVAVASMPLVGAKPARGAGVPAGDGAGVAATRPRDEGDARAQPPHAGAIVANGGRPPPLIAGPGRIFMVASRVTSFDSARRGTLCRRRPRPSRTACDAHPDPKKARPPPVKITRSPRDVTGQVRWLRWSKRADPPAGSTVALEWPESPTIPGVAISERPSPAPAPVCPEHYMVVLRIVLADHDLLLAAARAAPATASISVSVPYHRTHHERPGARRRRSLSPRSRICAAFVPVVDADAGASQRFASVVAPSCPPEASP